MKKLLAVPMMLLLFLATSALTVSAQYSTKQGEFTGNSGSNGYELKGNVAWFYDNSSSRSTVYFQLDVTPGTAELVGVEIISVRFYDRNNNIIYTVSNPAAGTNNGTYQSYSGCAVPSGTTVSGYYNQNDVPLSKSVFDNAVRADFEFYEILDGGGCVENFLYPDVLMNIPLQELTYGVLLGTEGRPDAVGTTNNDDYTNKTITGFIPTSGSLSSASSVVFVNTLRNDGNQTDSYVVISPIVPAGFTVEASTDCANFTTLSGGGGLLVDNLAPGQSQNVCVRVTAAPGTPTLQGFATTIRATSQNDSSKFNDTIDRLYTGFIASSKTATISNTTGKGGANDPVPGAH